MENKENLNQKDEERVPFLDKERKIRAIKFILVSLGGLGFYELFAFLSLLFLDATTDKDPIINFWIINIHKVVVAGAVAILIVMFYNYIINKIWTYKKLERSTDFNTLHQFIKFALVGASGAIINLGLVHLISVILGWNEYLAFAIGFIVSVITNFILNDIWTFNPKFGKKKEIQED
ncbi:MAG: GtrA family protein [Candidatus Heimdallarchaeota archaeon]|nr:GtrA family protein [Candidatus Heimdallarchaeota archaeon]